MSTTIQINSREALERLLGGDEQLHITARNSIVQDFTRKYLKSLVSLEVVQNEVVKLRKDLDVIVRDKITEAIGTFKKGHYGDITEVKLLPEIEQHLKRCVDSHIYELIRNIVEEKIKSMNIEKMINSTVEASVGFRIRDGVKKRLDEIAKTI